jgi:hypothetical protein
MEAAVFFSLVLRLPAYSGVLAARLAKENGSSPQRQAGGRMTYEAGSGAANIARTASHAPPASRAQLLALNSQLGGNFFSTAAVKKGG